MIARVLLRHAVGALMAASLLVGPTFGARAATDASANPTAVIEKFHTSLLDVMKHAKSLGYNGRFHELAPAIDEAFHLPAMARIVAGQSFWNKFDDAQKRALVDAFSRMTIATYAHRFNGYSGETFRTVQAVPIRDRTILVRTQLVKSNGEPVELSYLLRQFSSGWRVIDIYLKGSISEIATKRSEYSSVLRREGLKGLLNRIDSTVASLETDSTK
jgi:phospholipid transport system substrate-binding protein